MRPRGALGRALRWALGASALAACSGGGGGAAPTPATVPGPASPNPIGLALEPLPAATAAPSITVAGRAAFGGSTITVVGGTAPVSGLADVDGDFALDVPLAPDAHNPLWIVETTASGTVRPAVPATVAQDGTPPTLDVDFPPPGAVLDGTSTRVTGRVGDRASGVQGLTVTVAGQAADVAVGFGTDGTFWIDDVALAPSASTPLAVVATDAVGHSTSATVTVTSAPPSGFVLSLADGDGQVAAAGSELAAPLVVQLVRPDGTALAGKLVQFEVEAGGGELSSGGDPPAQRVGVFTDAGGRAAVRWRVGSNAGLGVGRVRASSVDVEGRAFFFASVTPSAARQVHAVDGALEVAPLGGVAPKALVARVTDGHNAIAGAAVRFDVATGGGLVRDPATGVQGPSVTATTDAAGAARALFFLDDTAAVQRVDARLVGAPDAGAASFVVRAVDGEAPSTTLTGRVVDGVLRPLVGATCRLKIGGAAFTVASSEQGTFTFQGLPAPAVGTLTVDGTSVVAALGPLGFELVSPANAAYPAAEHRVLLEPGTVHRLSAPLILPRIEAPVGFLYDGTTDAVLGLADLPGFELLIEAGSLTLPPNTPLGNGALLGATVTPSPTSPLAVPAVLAAVQVGIDELPAPLADGAPADLAWYLSPGGASVSTPVRVRTPNLAGLAPTARATLSVFDARAGRFERAATLVAEAGGARLTTEPGSGPLVSGWTAVSVGGAVGGAVVFDSALPAFDEDWTVRFGGRPGTGLTGAGFALADVPLRDAFGPPGDETTPDGVADRALRLSGIGLVGGALRFASTPAWSLAPGATFELPPGTLSPLPPPLPETLDLSIAASALDVGQQTTASVLGILSSGAFSDLSTAATGTTWATSDARVATVGASGVVTAVAPGSVTVNAFQDGLAAAVALAVLDPAPALADVVGTVAYADGAPAVGVDVLLAGDGQVAVTDQDGAFRFEDVPAAGHAALTLTASTAASGDFLVESATVEVGADAVTDAGVLVLGAAERVLVFGEPVGDGLAATLAQAALVAAGFQVDLAPTLPANLDAYRFLWSVQTSAGFDDGEEQALVAFVNSGRGLHLSGERPCCAAANASVEGILAALLVAPIAVGAAGDVSGPYLVNASVIADVDQVPFDLGGLALCAAGGLDVGLGAANVLARGAGDVPVAAVFDGFDLVGGKGRVSVVMDSDWEFSAGCENAQFDADDAIANLAHFLDGATAP